MIQEGQASEAEVEAAAWDARIRSPECSAGERDRFDQWLRSDPEHHEAFGRLQQALSLLRASEEHPQIRALRESALLMERRERHKRRSFQWAAAAGTLFVVLSVGYGALQALRSHPDDHSGQAVMQQTIRTEGEWSTGVQERRTVILPDGSSATLNASTRLQANAFGAERRVVLLAGQAFFRVTKDPTRPFIVTAGTRTVTALGTAFDVRLEQDRVEVTLLEGRVAIKNLGASTLQPAIELKPSEQLLASDRSAPTVRTVNAVAETAWTNGQIVFVDEALPQAVAQMNRYSAERIIAGPELSRYRVNGMFLAGNQEGFVTALTSYFPLEAVRDSENHLILKSRTPPSQ